MAQREHCAFRKFEMRSYIYNQFTISNKLKNIRYQNWKNVGAITFS